jgi:hypothetical protein
MLMVSSGKDRFNSRQCSYPNYDLCTLFSYNDNFVVIGICFTVFRNYGSQGDSSYDLTVSQFDRNRTYE